MAAAAAGGQERLYSISLFRWKDTPSHPVMLCEAIDCSPFSFFQRSSVREFIVFISRTLADPQRTQPGTRQQVEKDDYRIYVHTKTDGLSCVVIANEHYLSQTAFMVCSKTLQEFGQKFAGQWEMGRQDGACPWPELEQRLAKYQNPEEADKILKIQRDLEEVKTVMMQNIDKVCERGTKLDELVAQSEDLSGASKSFYKTAKRQNACCVLM
eukprot:TRINITY_DN8728_c0_g1_i1.p2 TRINITY_DN8728_c0_g1~~TRINITY_DN8728_c0_g1_i1.p2  ORF type:complete len:245 (+),score=121.71 TRINITY_DN8728_c0_g1_i1:101-736(+)